MACPIPIETGFLANFYEITSKKQQHFYFSLLKEVGSITVFKKGDALIIHSNN